MFTDKYNNKYVRAINEVIAYLIPAGVPFTVNPAYEGMQLRFPWHEGDVACHEGTCGSDCGCVESYQFPWDDDDVTVQTPYEMANDIIRLYLEGSW